MRWMLTILFCILIASTAGAQTTRELNAAITDKDLTKVSALLAAGVSPAEPFKSTGGDYVSPFILAVRVSTPQVAELMLQYKAHEKSTIKTFHGTTPLQLALLSAKNTEMAEMLLRKGFRIDELNSAGLSALTAAIITKKDEAIEWLVQHHADVNVVDYRGRTPIMYALEQGNEAVFVYLLKQGASLRAIDLMNQTPLGIVKNAMLRKERILDSESTSEMDMVEAAYDIDDLEYLEDTLTSLHVPEKPPQELLAARSPANQALSAVMRQDTAQLKALLNAGVPVETRNLRGETLLQLAISLANRAMTHMLINRGADINTVNNLGNDAFMQAAINMRLKPAILVYQTGKFTRYRAWPMPNNNERKSVLDYIKTNTDGSMPLFPQFQAIHNQLVSADTSRYGLLLNSTGQFVTYSRELGLLHKTVLELEQLYESLPATHASSLFSEAVALKDSSFIFSLWNRAANLDRRYAFVTALSHGNTSLAKVLFASGKTGVDVNAKTEWAAGTSEKFTLYHHFANKYNVQEGRVTDVLLTLIELGDTSHRKKVRQLHSTWKDYGDEGQVLQFLKDAQDKSVEELNKIYRK